jgi:beta-phosphoglucomutase-like phosphatase (HAD superfamily)
LINVLPSDCLVFEDAPKGVEAAYEAGMACVVLTTMHTRDEFPIHDHVVSFANDYTDPFFKTIF